MAWLLASFHRWNSPLEQDVPITGIGLDTLVLEHQDQFEDTVEEGC